MTCWISPSGINVLIPELRSASIVRSAIAICCVAELPLDCADAAVVNIEATRKSSAKCDLIAKLRLVANVPAVVSRRHTLTGLEVQPFFVKHFPQIETGFDSGCSRLANKYQFFLVR
jgi:hypothetical protein